MPEPEGADFIEGEAHELPPDGPLDDPARPSAEPPTGPPQQQAPAPPAASRQPGSEVVRQPPGSGLAVTPAVEAAELVKRLEVIKQAMNEAMHRDVDYGVIPGTDKPALYKPGAEKLGVLFQLDVQLANECHYGPGDHLTVNSRATVFHAPTGIRLGFGEGLCTTRERKYGKRKQNRKCPNCEAEAVIKGKEEYGGGWLCWRKRDGCGATFPDADPAITGQEVGEIENPDLPDTWNTVVKMAEKRARVDAVLAVTGASALFTQDVEDGAPAPSEGEPPATEPLPKYGPEAGEKFAARALTAVAFLADSGAGPDQKMAEEWVGLLLNGQPELRFPPLGYLPGTVAAAMVTLAIQVKKKVDALGAQADAETVPPTEQPAPAGGEEQSQ